MLVSPFDEVPILTQRDHEQSFTEQSSCFVLTPSSNFSFTGGVKTSLFHLFSLPSQLLFRKSGPFQSLLSHEQIQSYIQGLESFLCLPKNISPELLSKVLSVEEVWNLIEDTWNVMGFDWQCLEVGPPPQSTWILRWITILKDTESTLVTQPCDGGCQLQCLLLCGQQQNYS